MVQSIATSCQRGHKGSVMGSEPAVAQGNRVSCRDQEGRRGSEEAVPGPSVFPSREPGVSGDFWGSQEGCQGQPAGQPPQPDTQGATEPPGKPLVTTYANSRWYQRLR